MNAPQKSVRLTKKQKKGIAFRQRKSHKGREKDGGTNSEDLNVSVLEDEDPLAFGSDILEMEEVVEAKSSKPATQVSNGGVPSKSESKAAAADVSKSKKRHRNMEDDVSSEKSSASKRQKTLEGAEQEVTKETTRQRLILFLGNLKYTTSIEAIKNHFNICNPAPEVRLLTPKPTLAKSTPKSKGCAFLEFTHRHALQQGLKLHHSTLEGRMINVELTAGGGGNSEKRLQKLKQRNKQLLGRKKERSEKATAEGIEEPTTHDKRRRYSTTSGIDQIPSTPKTWTVGNTDDDGTSRGGKKHKKRAKSQLSRKVWGTGVNAIPVG